ncbi:MAG: DOMON-like domain-containing protein [Phenylobacterium sp.]
MLRTLIPHSDQPTPAGLEVAVDCSRAGSGRLALTWRASGIDQVRWPEPAAPARRDGLWEHTCFEAFVRPGEGPGYLEFNLSPSGAWAAYRFDDYRAGMAPAPVDAPRAVAARPEGVFELSAMLDLSGLPGVADRPWSVGVSAVIEALDGAKSYWALSHPPGKADFHHADCFGLTFPARHLA